MKIRVIELDDIGAARQAIARTGADPYSVSIMAPKAVFKALFVENVDNRAAALLKQEMLSLGGEAAVSEKVSRFEKGFSGVLLMGTLKILGQLMKKLPVQPFGLKAVAEELGKVLLDHDKQSFCLKAGNFTLKLGGRALVMGILNVTPDSFSDAGNYRDADKAVARALEMAREGAGIIDVGGESSRPGARPVSEKEEIARVIPVIRGIAKKINIPLSIDTYKPSVALAALRSGACMVNDITALRWGGQRMARAAAKHGAAVILMHMLGTPQTMQKKPAYRDVVAEIGDFFEERIAFAERSGIEREKLLIDPGIGFGKTLGHNLEILKRFGEFKSLGVPAVAGLSRKSFIGELSRGAPVSERLPGSLSGNIWAAMNGASVLRVHDVKETVQALAVLQGIAFSG